MNDNDYVHWVCARDIPGKKIGDFRFWIADCRFSLADLRMKIKLRFTPIINLKQKNLLLTKPLDFYKVMSPFRLEAQNMRMGATYSLVVRAGRFFFFCFFRTVRPAS